MCIYRYVLNFVIAADENNIDIVMLDNDERQKLLFFFPFLKERVIGRLKCIKFVCLSHPIRNQQRINHSKTKNPYAAKSDQG